MIISLVVAASTNNAIGFNNQLLWHLPNDMRFFKNTTWGMPVVMGRKTFESMGAKQLGGRMNIVITRNKHWDAAGINIVHSLQEAVALAAGANYREVFIIGGGEIYKEALPVANKIYLTRVDVVMEGDSFFPVLEEKSWDRLSEENFPADAKHPYTYHFQVWQRIQS
ncbi:MAG: hypothetical protein RLZZ28_1031 [Bacteroidota bacterium]|jgi:dihydrofolate reductase